MGRAGYVTAVTCKGTLIMITASGGVECGIVVGIINDDDEQYRKDR